MKPNNLNKYQQQWCIAKAKKAVLWDELKKHEQDPLRYREYAEMYTQAINDLKIATAELLTFAKERMKTKYADRWSEDLEKLYSDKIENYCMTDLLPNWWQSKLVESTMKTNFER